MDTAEQFLRCYRLLQKILVCYSSRKLGVPPNALPFRAEQMAYLSGQAHRSFTAAKVGELIAECERHGFRPAELDEAANVRERRRSTIEQPAFRRRLVEKFERVRAHAREAWRNAREKSQFKLFKPHLDKVLDLSRQMADCWGFQESPYDALREEYGAGTRARTLRETFSELRAALVSILPAAMERSAAVSTDILQGEYPVAAQQAFNRRVAEAIGFDFKSGRIDTTTHPFCSRIGAGDRRLTTRYNERNFTQSLYCILHEGGHGLYEQGLAQDQFGLPTGSAVSLAIHESQSRLWENHVGRSLAFWRHWHPVEQYVESSKTT